MKTRFSWGKEGGTYLSRHLEFRNHSQPLLAVGHRILAARRDIVVRAAIQDSASFAFAHASPLLEEEWNVGGQTLIAQRLHPSWIKRPGAVPTLAPHNHPGNAR